MIKSKVIFKPAIKYLQNVSKQSQYATVVSLTKTAWDVKGDETKALGKYLKNPTPFTRRAFRVRRASKSRMVSSVYAAPVQERYLSRQVHGGMSKGHVPGKHQNLNAYGNLPRRATKRKKAFSATIKGLSGTWETYGGKKNRKVRLIAHYPASRRYRERLPFYAVARTTVHKRFPDHYRQEFKKALRSAR